LVSLALAVGLMALTSGHILHAHPHRPGHEAPCAVCDAPLAPSAPGPTLAPPIPVLTRLTARGPAASQSTRAPLSFSPKQSPPS
jgi:hypothetical protein